MRLESPWSDLEHRGFVVIRSLISPVEVIAQREAFLAFSQESWKLTGFSLRLEPDAEAPLRACSFERVLTKRTLYTMSPRKFSHLMRKAGGIRRMFAAVIAAFWYYRAPHITYRQLEAMREELRKRRPCAVAMFLTALTLYPVVMRWHYRRQRPATNGSG